MSNGTMQEIGEAVREVLKHSVNDPDFRQFAVTDARAAIRKVNPSLDIDFRIRFIDNFGSDHKTIVLPDPISDAGNLSEEELEQIAGGKASCFITSCGTSS